MKVFPVFFKDFLRCPAGDAELSGIGKGSAEKRRNGKFGFKICKSGSAVLYYVF